MNFGRIMAIAARVSEVKASLPSILEEVVNEKKDLLLSFNRDQLLLGRLSTGELITPTYLDDPYFKTPAAAKRYAKMKKKLESYHRTRISNVNEYPDKPENTPNLIVTGVLFQDYLFIETGNGTYTIGSSGEAADDINEKYNNLVFGIAPPYRRQFYNDFILPKLKQKIFGE